LFSLFLEYSLARIHSSTSSSPALAVSKRLMRLWFLSFEAHTKAKITFRVEESDACFCAKLGNGQYVGSCSDLFRTKKEFERGTS